MPIRRSPFALMLSAALVAPGCSRSDSAREPADSAPASASTSWYSRGRTLDLTGDGRADSVHLVALGTPPDSLRISLSFLVDGEEKHREQWGSSYELALLDSAARASPRVEVTLLTRLDSVLSSVVVEPFDAPGVQTMAEDSSILAGLVPRPAQRVSFAYGYETTVRMLWDASRQRFVRLWSCC